MPVVRLFARRYKRQIAKTLVREATA